MTVNAVKNKELKQKEPQLSDKYMYQKIPCRGVGKNYKVILKYWTNFCIQFNVTINSLYLFIYFIQVQHQATLSCHLPRVAVRQRTTYCVADDTPLAQLLQQMLHETEMERQSERETAKK